VSPEWWNGRMLQQARHRRNLTQAALAKRIDVHQVTIARLESGSRKPSMDMLHRLAKVLKVKARDLLA